MQRKAVGEIEVAVVVRFHLSPLKMRTVEDYLVLGQLCMIVIYLIISIIQFRWIRKGKLRTIDTQRHSIKLEVVSGWAYMVLMLFGAVVYLIDFYFIGQNYLLGLCGFSLVMLLFVTRTINAFQPWNTKHRKPFDYNLPIYYLVGGPRKNSLPRNFNYSQDDLGECRCEDCGRKIIIKISVYNLALEPEKYVLTRLVCTRCIRNPRYMDQRKEVIGKQDIN